MKKLPYAFTEQGIYMLATVLRGELAEQQSIFIMRAFREMRHFIKQNQQFVTSAEMKLVTAKVSDISVQVAGISDWKKKAENVYHFDDYLGDLSFKVELDATGYEKYYKMQNNENAKRSADRYSYVGILKQLNNSEQ